MIEIILAAVVFETSAWCADRRVGESEKGRYAVNYIWEGEQQEDGTVLCRPLGPCARADSSQDSVVGIPDFNLLVECWGAQIEDHVPPE